MTPAALNREQAAEYVGVSPNSFDKLVRAVDTIPERLVELGFVRSEKLRSTIGMVKMVWVATRNGRIFVARSEE